MKKAFLITTIIFLTILGVVWYLNYQIKYIDREGVYLHNYRDMGNLKIEAGQNFDITQQILPSRNDLAYIFVTLKITEPINIDFKITDSDNNLVREKTMNINEVLGYIQFITWEFEPINDSGNQAYLFSLAGRTEDNSLTFYTVSPDKYDGGQLTINGLANTKERIIVDWQYPASHLWQNIITRLVYAKPGIFNHQSAFLVLIIIFAGLLFYSIFLLAKEFFG